MIQWEVPPYFFVQRWESNQVTFRTMRKGTITILYLKVFEVLTITSYGFVIPDGEPKAKVFTYKLQSSHRTGTYPHAT